MTFIDHEFGEIILRRNAWAKNPKFSVSTSGKLAMSVPSYVSLATAKRWLNASRAAIRKQLPLADPATQRARDARKKHLAKQARDYLPYRLDFWAQKYGYDYRQLRLTHAGTRWGSRSSTGTISLNIGLMKVPEVLRDYVILHELAHINHMDHSSAFWEEVAAHDPNYKKHRKALKLFTPGV